MVQNVCELAETLMNESFCDKSFMIVTLFCDYRRAAGTIHVVAPPTIGVGLEVCKCEKKQIKRN